MAAPCPVCGFDGRSVSPGDAAVALRSFPRRYRQVIGPFIEDDEVLRRRPDANTWSALEYTAHVADVLESMTPMLVEMVQKDDPRIPDPWDPDAQARDRNYNDMEPQEVLDWLARAANNAAETAGGFSADEWSRTGEFDYGQREVIDQLRNMVHEGVHHLRDVENVLRAVIGKPLPTDEDDD